MCYDKATMQYIRRLGFNAQLYKSENGKKIMRSAGVYVVDQMKEVFQPELAGITVLNLWHGVGCKSIERKVSLDFLILKPNMAKKYIDNNTVYRNNQLFLVTSPLMEEHFKNQCGLEDDKIIRGGYPCCMYQKYYGSVETYSHDILKRRGLSEDTKIAVYAPTYRDSSAGDFFKMAVTDMEKLIRTLRKNKILLIFKMHPFMSNDYHYQNAKRTYKNVSNLLFWDNQNDIYEILDKVDLAIVDYSSMFYDMLAVGVKHFIRYMFDIDNSENVRDFVFDVRKMTCGTECFDFEQLLDVLSSEKNETDSEKERIYNLFWKYDCKESFENIIEQTMAFVPETRQLPVLYSFDIFDTLIQRKAHLPKSIFLKIQEKLINTGMNFPDYIKRCFVSVRMDAEADAREYYKKLQDVGYVDRLEISLDEIYEWMGNVYHLTREQIEILKNLELEAEFEDCIPYAENIEIVKSLLEKDEKVILLSDMYLPKEFIRRMLGKADKLLETLPLYLSSDVGYQKSTKRLFLYAFKDLEYDYGQWIHYGDNLHADKKMPGQLGIKTINHKVTGFNEYEKYLAESINSYDAYLTAAMMARFRENCDKETQTIFTYEYASLYFVPYIGSVIKDALKRKIKCLYFISRDGYHLKRIADAIIEDREYPIKTKYIYGSRKAWRIPSFIEKIDDEFFTNFGQFVGCKTFEMLLKALGLEEAEFDEMFPELLEIKSQKKISKKTLVSLRKIFKSSEKYKTFIMGKAEKERPIVLDYLKQEINFDESFAFVEYWGRGYTQDCLSRLICEAAGRQIASPCYYARSIYPSEGLSVRYNFTTTRKSLIFVEALFANLPHKTVTEYERKDGVIYPVLNECENDMILHSAFEKYLVKFAKDFYSNTFVDEDEIEHELFDFAVKYYHERMSDKYIVENIGHLKDSVEMYGKVREFAPPVTIRAIIQRLFGVWFDTKAIRISVERSNPIFGKIYLLYHNKLRHKKIIKQCSRGLKKIKKIIH